MNTPILLMLETSTECCSAAIARGTEKIVEVRTETSKQHASQLAPFIQELLKKEGLKVSDCDAVAVSEGPGSYTGLRVGVSTAKGLCFGSGKPLISVGTLRILAMQGRGKADIIVPMIDARRMEVYSAVFDSQGNEIRATEATILDENSFADLLKEHTVLFIGDGAAKFSTVCKSPNASFEQCFPLASAMAEPAIEAYNKKEFKDVAYFEPFYLKEFVAGISRKSVL